MDPVKRLPGMRDQSGLEYEELRSAAGILGSFFRDRGYEPIDTPMLEQTELFVRKSGGALTSQLCTFTDAVGRRVSLRPEFTSSVIRHFIDSAGSAKLPVRRQYSGPVFRYETAGSGEVHQFHQVGVELVGATGAEADAEVIGMTMAGLDEAGLSQSQVRVGHVGLLRNMLTAEGLSESAVGLVIGNVESICAGRMDLAELLERAGQVGLLRATNGLGADGDEAHIGADQRLVRAVLSEAESSPLGRRTTDEIVERLLRKLREADDPTTLAKGLSLVQELAGLEGGPDAVLNGAASIAESRGTAGSHVLELQGLLTALAGSGLDTGRVVIDLRMVRDISYYTGVTFDIVVTPDEETIVLGGGGRYDDLVRALGGQDVPALGFAYNLDLILEARNASGRSPQSVASTTSAGSQ